MASRELARMASNLDITLAQATIMRDAAVREYREQGRYLGNKTHGLKMRITRAMRRDEDYRQAVFAWWREKETTP